MVTGQILQSGVRPGLQSGNREQLLQHQIERTLLLLKEYAGFYPTSSLKNKLERLFANIDDATLTAWVDDLDSRKDAHALNTLVEDLTNHETYFFREKVQLDLLLDHVLPKLIQQKKEERSYCIRIWSAACSTGEEPYTLTMLALTAFVKAGIAHETASGVIELPSPWRLEVYATDISRQALKIAGNAIYLERHERLNPFRQMPERFMKFFQRIEKREKTGETVYRVNDTVRQYVRFEWFNLKNNTPPFTNMDVVFCRNVLIYIDAREHGNLQNMLARALNKTGCLFLGLVDNLSESARLKANHNHTCTFYEHA